MYNFSLIISDKLEIYRKQMHNNIVIHKLITLYLPFVNLQSLTVLFHINKFMIYLTFFNIRLIKIYFKELNG